MSTRTVLVCSLALNLALGAAAVFLWKKPPVSAPPEVRKQTVTNVVVRGAIRPGLTNANLSGIIANIWRVVESPDYQKYIANLRVLGCPEETIRDIIITDLNKLYAQKARALNPELKTNRYWLPETTADSGPMREYARQLRQLEREKKAIVSELLGVDYQAEMAKQLPQPTYLDRQLAFLPEEKRQQIRLINEKYAELEQEILDQISGEITPQAMAALENLRQQRRTEITGTLTATEMLEYEMRTSPSAQNLRYQMGAFSSASEETFRKVFGLQQKYEEQAQALQAAGTLSPEARQQLDSQMQTEMKSLLGDRYAEFQRTQDAGYREIYQAAQRNNLPVATAATVYEMKRVAEEQRRLLLANEQLEPEQVEAGMTALHAETERAVREAMGEKAFEDYQKRGGNWLLNLGVVEKK